MVVGTALPGTPRAYDSQGHRQVSDLRLYCILCSFALAIPIQLSLEKTDKDGGRQDVVTLKQKLNFQALRVDKAFSI